VIYRTPQLKHVCPCASPKPCRYIWASGADGAFTVSEDEGENEDLGRGTLIKIHLKEGEEVRLLQDML
jgi:HSP90 family molecular chaperone